MLKARLLLLAVLAAVCTTAIAHRSRATDTGEDPQCASECSLQWRDPGPEVSRCYDVCVQSKDGSIGCSVVRRGPRAWSTLEAR
jgi:hypothetical protein